MPTGLDRRQKQYTSIGGQAVIEGVMMRSPNYVVVAVRGPNREIVLKSEPYQPASLRHRWLKWPVVRGAWGIFESLVLGMRALGWSASVQDSSDSEAEGQSSVALAIIPAIIFTLVLFVGIPHGLAWVASQWMEEGPDSRLFQVVEGMMKLAIFLGYIGLISRMKEIERVFQYHGAEHKAIAAFEAGVELNPKSAAAFSRFHPRCGTSFLLFLVVMSILIFSIVIPLFGAASWFGQGVSQHLSIMGLKILLMLPIAGLSYELIKWSAAHSEIPIFRFLIGPGLVLQSLTTKEPTEDQLEIGLAALKQALLLEQKKVQVAEVGVREDRLATFDDLISVSAPVSDFLEV